MADGSPTKRSLIWRLWGLIMFLLVAAALGSSAFLYRRLQREAAARAALATEVAAFGPRFEQFKGAVRDVGKQLSTTVFQEVDLAAPRAGSRSRAASTSSICRWPPRAKGRASAARSSTRPPCSTRPPSSRCASTSIARPSRSRACRPGVAQPFETTLADVEPAAAKKAFFALDSSTISFASSTTRKRGAGEPPDTDKLLK